MIERVIVHGKARVLRAAHAIHHFGPRRGALDADDVDARHHHFLHLGVAEREDAAQDRALLAWRLRTVRNDVAQLRRRPSRSSLSGGGGRSRAQHAVDRGPGRDERVHEQLERRDEGREAREHRRADHVADLAREHLAEDEDRRRCPPSRDRAPTTSAGRAHSSARDRERCRAAELREEARDRERAMRALALVAARERAPFAALCVAARGEQRAIRERAARPTSASASTAMIQATIMRDLQRARRAAAPAAATSATSCASTIRDARSRARAACRARRAARAPRDGHAVLDRVRARDCRRDVDVADHRAIRCREPAKPKEITSVATAMPEVLRVESRDRRVAHEGDREHRVPHALRPRASARAIAATRGRESPARTSRATRRC